MQLAVEIQAQILKYLPDEALYHLASPRGLGIVAFNLFYRRLWVVSLENSQYIAPQLDADDFAVQAARFVYNGRQLVDFCARHPYFKPHTLDFMSVAHYLEVMELAPKIVESAVRLNLEFENDEKYHTQLSDPQSAGLPGLFSNIRRYTCSSTVRFEEFTKNLGRLLPQLEELGFDFDYLRSRHRVHGYHHCDFEHPRLRKLHLMGAFEDVKYLIVRVPAGVREIQVSQVSVMFAANFDWARMPIKTLSVWPSEALEFRGQPRRLPTVETLKVVECDNVHQYIPTIESRRMRSVEIDSISREDFFAIVLPEHLTKIKLKIYATRMGDGLQFHDDFSGLRELSLDYQSHSPDTRMAIFSPYSVCLEKIEFTNCLFFPRDQAFHELVNLHTLRLDSCLCDGLDLPPNLVELSITNGRLQQLVLPPKLKKFTLLDSMPCSITANPGLESFTLDLDAGQDYHGFPNLLSLTLRSRDPLSGWRGPATSPHIPLTAANVTLPSSLTSLCIVGADASGLELPPSLVRLTLHDCCLTHIPTLPKLKYLNIADNGMQLPQSLPPTVRWLDISGNKTAADLDWTASNVRFIVADAIDHTSTLITNKIALPTCVDLVVTASEDRFVPSGPTEFSVTWRSFL